VARFVSRFGGRRNVTILFWMHSGQSIAIRAQQQVKAAQKLRDQGEPVAMLAKKFGVSRGTIRNYTVARRRRK